MVIDFGARTTNMAIFQENLQVVASTPVGAENIKETLVSTLGIDIKEANKLLFTGLKNEDKAAETIRTELRKIMEEVDRLLKYYKGKNDDRTIDQILLCGGIGSMSGLAEFIESETKVKAKAGNPWSNISVYPIKPVPRDEASLYSAAIGLCLRGLSD